MNGNLPNECDDVSLTPGDVKYVDRDEKGRLLPGHQLRKLEGKNYNRLHELRQLWWNAITDERMQAVTDGLYDLALNCTDPRIRLAAQLNILDRSIGKPSESINLNVNDNGNATGFLSHDQLDDNEKALLVKLVGKTRPNFGSACASPVVVEALPSSPVCNPEVSS